jgi:hypothetical protein
MRGGVLSQRKRPIQQFSNSAIELQANVLVTAEVWARVNVREGMGTPLNKVEPLGNTGNGVVPSPTTGERGERQRLAEIPKKEEKKKKIS